MTARRVHEINPAVILGIIGVVLFGAISLGAALYFIIRCLFLARWNSMEPLYARRANIAAIDSLIRDVRETGQAEGIPIRKDGCLDGRYIRGRVLNCRLDKLFQDREAAWEAVCNIEYEAIRHSEVWAFNHAGRMASLVSVGTYSASIATLYICYPDVNPFVLSFAAGVASMASGIPTFIFREKFLQDRCEAELSVFQAYGSHFFDSVENDADEGKVFESVEDADEDKVSEPDEYENSDSADRPSRSDGTRRPARSEQPESRTWFEVLMVAPDASLDEIKSAYRTIIMQYHPDRVGNLGAELRTLADTKTKEINVAYEEATHRR